MQGQDESSSLVTWDCPPHEGYSVPNWVPKDWMNRVTECITNHLTWRTMSEQAKADLDRFVVSTKTEKLMKEGMTWEAVYNLSMACLKYPEFEKRYRPWLSKEKAGHLITTKYRPQILEKHPNVSEKHLERTLEKMYFQLLWKITQEHLVLLKDIALASGVTLKTLMEVDLEVRRRTMIEMEEGSNEGYIETSNGLSYVYFLYVNGTTTRGRWMMVGHVCKACNKHHDYKGEFFMYCQTCGDALLCSHCDKTHVHV